MDKRILDIVSNQYLAKKDVQQLELEKLINNTYNISVEETTERIMRVISDLNETVQQMRLWEDILNQVTPIKPEQGNNK
jgi:hypothetical protein